MLGNLISSQTWGQKGQEAGCRGGSFGDVLGAQGRERGRAARGAGVPTPPEALLSLLSAFPFCPPSTLELL